jgi:acetyl esterase/lipase
MNEKNTPPSHYGIAEQPPSANTSFVRRRFLDIVYADLSPSQKLDIYLPDEGNGQFPVIVAIHGGAFMGCDKADMQVLPMLAGLKRGYAVVSINYRLSWQATFPALIQDAKAAVRWIRANASQFSFDTQKVAAWGGSAGGYLATMLGVSAGVAELEDLNLGNSGQPCDLQAVVSWYGPTNFLNMDTLLAESGLLPPEGFRHSEANSPESLLLGAQITTVPERVRAANPETFIRPTAPPFFLQHGRADAVVPFQHSVQLAEKLRQSIGKERVRLELMEGAAHADPRFESTENVNKVLDFLDRSLQ